MRDELVDIVDENGSFHMTVSKKESHARGLLHTCVIAEVIDSNGRWLMVKQARDRQDAGQYVSPIGGHVTAGETEEDALRREAREELGLTEKLFFTHVGRAIFRRTVLGRDENHLFALFTIASDTPPILNKESDDYRYFTEEELKKKLAERPALFGNAFHFVAHHFYPHLVNPELQEQ